MSETSYNNKLLPSTSKDSRSIKPGYMIFNTGYIVSWDIIWHYDITPKPIAIGTFRKSTSRDAYTRITIEISLTYLLSTYLLLIINISAILYHSNEICSN
jgi:hypothetical protein